MTFIFQVITSKNTDLLYQFINNQTKQQKGHWGVNAKKKNTIEIGMKKAFKAWTTYNKKHIWLNLKISWVAPGQ